MCLADLAAERRQPTSTSRQTLVEINNNTNEQNNKSQAARKSTTTSDAKQKAKEHLIADVYHFVKNDSNVMDTLNEYSSEKQLRRKNKPRQSIAKRKLEMELTSSDSDTVANQVKAVHTPPDSLINSKKYDDTTIAHQEEVMIDYDRSRSVPDENGPVAFICFW